MALQPLRECLDIVLYSQNVMTTSPSCQCGHGKSRYSHGCQPAIGLLAGFR
jgi:hypothetical protein